MEERDPGWSTPGRSSNVWLPERRARTAPLYETSCAVAVWGFFGLIQRAQTAGLGQVSRCVEKNSEVTYVQPLEGLSQDIGRHIFGYLNSWQPNSKQLQPQVDVVRKNAETAWRRGVEGVCVLRGWGGDHMLCSRSHPSCLFKGVALVVRCHSIPFSLIIGLFLTSYVLFLLTLHHFPTPLYSKTPERLPCAHCLQFPSAPVLS